jgi:hypothetical protein
MSSIKTELSIPLLLRDGLTMSLVVGGLVLGSLRYNPEMWLQDYPPDVKAKFGPMSERARREQRIFLVPFFVTFFSIPLRSAQRLKAKNGGALSFKAAFVHCFLLYELFVLFDTFVIDLGLVKLQPKWMVLPGTEGMAGYKDFDHTLKVTYFSPGPWLGAVIISLIVAGVVTLRR